VSTPQQTPLRSMAGMGTILFSGSPTQNAGHWHPLLPKGQRREGSLVRRSPRCSHYERVMSTSLAHDSSLSDEDSRTWRCL